MSEESKCPVHQGVCKVAHSRFVSLRNRRSWTVACPDRTGQGSNLLAILVDCFAKVRLLRNFQQGCLEDGLQAET